MAEINFLFFYLFCCFYFHHRILKNFYIIVAKFIFFVFRLLHTFWSIFIFFNSSTIGIVVRLDVFCTSEVFCGTEMAVIV